MTKPARILNTARLIDIFNLADQPLDSITDYKRIEKTIGIGNLKVLETISGIEVSEIITNVINQLAKIPSLTISDGNGIIKIEDSTYTQKLNDIFVPTFERIRRVSMNYINNEDNSDNAYLDMYKYIAKYGRRDKALLYSSFDTILEQFVGESIDIVDWGSEQSIAATLFLDYVREKQLDIKIENITLISDKTNSLSRGILHCNILKSNTEKIVGINKNIKYIGSDDFIIKGNTTVNLMYDRDIFYPITHNNSNMAYIIALRAGQDDNHQIAQLMYEYEKENQLKILSNRNDKIGKFQRSEAIFTIDKNNTLEEL